MSLMYKDKNSINECRNKKFSSLFYQLIILFLFLMGSVYVYEFANYLTFTEFGLRPQASWLWLLPTGVAATGSCGMCTTFLKPLQFAISVTLTLLLYFSLRTINLRFLKYGLLGVISINLASFYWESFSFFDSFPIAVHELLFVALTFVTTLTLTAILHIKG